ncbi:MAG: FG-GAP-like repeat-containing protein [Candidatus Zixiibacteriota bacterium]
MKCVGAVILWAVIFSITATDQARGDWIKGYFSPASKIDSIQRIAHIVDTKDSTYLGITIVPAGDVNSDGFQDFILCREKFQNTGRDDSCFLYLGGNPPSGVYAKGFAHLKYGMTNVGDVNGDGFPDFAVPAFYPPDTSQIELFFGGPQMDDTADFVFPHTFSRIPKAADLDGDGQLELALGDRNQGYVRIYSIGEDRDTIPKYIIPDTSNSFGNNLAVGDFNGDGYSDLAVAAYINRMSFSGLPPFVKFYWGGPTFDTIPDLQITDPARDFGRLLVPIGDFNGDGYEDIFVSGGSNNRYGIYFGGPNIDAQQDLCINWYDLFAPESASPAGDINHDGFPDLLVGETVAGTGYFAVYLGGPQADSLFDIQITFTDFPSESHQALGYEVRGLGDVNGDSRDDFGVFSLTQTVQGRGELDVFGGWNSSPTDVHDDHGSGLPTSFSLYPAYPNPFNPSTAISFDLPKRAGVKLIVFDVLGREVRRLVDQEMAAGAHSVSWNGTNDAGKAVASGVYFFKMVSGEFEKSVKGMLVK